MFKTPHRVAVVAASLSLAFGLVACGGSSDGPTAVAFQSTALAFVDPQNPIDLKSYTQTGRYSLPVGTGANLLAEEASAVTYNKDTGTLFVVGDGGTSITQVTKKGVLIDSMTLAADAAKPQGTYFYDPEGLTYLGGGKFAMVEERYRQVNEFTYAANTILGAAGVRTVKLGTTIGTIGIEGISFDPMTSGFIAVKESGPSGVFQTTVNFAAVTAANASPTTENSTNLFDPTKTGLTALNDVFALSNILASSSADFGNLMILSAPNGKIVKMSRAGELLGTLDVGSAAQNEGMTMDPDGVIYVVSEVGGGPGRPELLVFSPNVGKDAVAISSNLYLTFSQSVVVGTGSLTLSNGAGDTRTIAINDATQVKIRGNTLIIDPTTDLVAGTTYSVIYPAGLLKDALGNNAPASSGASTLVFTATGAVDKDVPILVSTSPLDEATDITSSRVVLTFNEQVVAGTGNIIISSTGDTRTIPVGDTTQVTFSGNTANINPSADLHKGTSYSVTFASGTIKDTVGNAFAGITLTTTLNFDMAAAVVVAPAAPSLLITEVNSNAAGGDFFEIYNYGTSSLDIGGWKWGDNKFLFGDSAVATFAPGTTIAAGQRLVVVNAAAAAFRTAWGLAADFPIATTDVAGPGLGKGDAVVLYNASGTVVAWLNYGADSAGFPHASPTSGVTFVAAAHAGPAFGAGADVVSAVWDGVSTLSPTYKAAAVDELGASAQPTVTTAIGSPGL